MEQRYSSRAALRAIFLLAWPTVLEQALTTAVSYVDHAMVGVLGASASAAVGATATIHWLVNSSVAALGIGFLAYIARECGAKRFDNAARASGQAVMAALVAGLGFTIPALLCSGMIPGWMQAAESVRAEAGQYFFIVYTVMPFRAASIVFGTVLRATGDTKTPMRVNAGMNLLNVVLNFFLIYPSRDATLLGFTLRLPGAGLGVSGAAIASAIAFCYGGVRMTLRLYQSPVASPRGMSLKPDWEVLTPCLRVALPAAMQRFITSFGYVAFSATINTLGLTATAAHALANTAESAFYIPGYGMQAAAATLAGNANGEGDRDKMRKITRTLVVVEVAMMTLSGAALFLYAEGMMRLFTRDAAVIALGATVLRMVALSEPAYGVAVILEGVFQGVGDTMHTFLYNIIGMWGIRILGTFLCVRVLGYGLPAAWGCMIAHNLFLAFMLALRYRRGRWNPLNRTP